MNTTSSHQLPDNFLNNSSNNNNNNNHRSTAKAPPSTTSSPSWLKLKNPRIVRVSRAFGGKDRHSKVCTVRGLRDRRIRLSVPTAIQLYDLQDRLGLSQPSKVVDWLLDAAKLDIDDLPPLHLPPLSFLAGEDWSTFWKGKAAKEENLIRPNDDNYKVPNYAGSWESSFGMSDVAVPGQILVQPYFPGTVEGQMSQFQMLMMSSAASSSSSYSSLGQPARPFHFTHVRDPQNEIKNQEQFQER